MDMEKLGAALAPIVRSAIEKATAPLLERIAVLEGQAQVPGPKGDPGDPGSDGKSVAIEDVERMVEARMAAWALDFERRAQGTLERAVDRLPKPADGKDGTDGKDGSNGIDGLGFDDLSVEQDEDGRVTLRFVRGDRTKEFALRFPVFIDRGVYREGEAYERGNGATFGGSYWLAQKDGALGKPGVSDDWRLAVKKGRDGRDGEKGERGLQGEKGLPGLNGRDLR